jgi:hypothetical protein
MHRRGLRPKNHPPPYAPPKATPEDTYVCYGCGIQKTERHFQELGVKHPDGKKCCFTCRGRPTMDEICDNLDKATLVQRSRF